MKRWITTDEAEEIWMSTNGGGLDSIKSTASNFSDFAEAISNDFASPTSFENQSNEGETNKGNEDCNFSDVTATEDADWLQAAFGPNSDIVSDTETIGEIPMLEGCDWDALMPDMDNVDGDSADDESKKTDDNPIAKRSKKASVPTVPVSCEQKPPQMPEKLLQEARKSTRTRKTKDSKKSIDKKKKTPRRRRTKGESKIKKKSSPADPTTTKRKREERLRRNRESANRSRIRKKKEMHELKQNVGLLRQKVVTLSERIEELEENNQNLREQLAMYKKPQNSYKPAVTVFALVFTVAFFAQPSTVPKVGLAQLPGQGASKVMSGFGNFGQGSKAFLLAPVIDLFSNSAVDAALSTPGLSTIISTVTRLFIAVALASICALCFHYFGGSVKWRNENRSKSPQIVPHILPRDELMLESVV